MRWYVPCEIGLVSSSNFSRFIRAAIRQVTVHEMQPESVVVEPRSPDLVPSAEVQRSSEVFRAIVVGDLHEIPFALQHPALAMGQRFEAVAVVPLDGHYDGVPADAIRTQVRAHNADTILVAGVVGQLAMGVLGEVAITLGCRLLALMPASVPAQLDPVIIWEGEHPLIQMAVTRDHLVRDAVKRAIDVVLSAIGLTIAAPVLLAAAFAIRWETPGSPIFGHVRIGRGGRRFRCWKLRTMAADAEQLLLADAVLLEAYQRNGFKLPDASDPRVTGVGRVLRQSSLDELPQLWNVLVGDMSLVGPRPLVADELRHYDGHVLTLLSVRPGLTGAWAVNGRHHLPYPQRAEIELDYVRTLALHRDLHILLRTASAVFDPGVGPRQ